MHLKEEGFKSMPKAPEFSAFFLTFGNCNSFLGLRFSLLFLLVYLLIQYDVDVSEFIIPYLCVSFFFFNYQLSRKIISTITLVEWPN